MDSKINLRAKAKDIRKTLDIPNISSLAVERIRQTKEYKAALNVLIFYPLKYEINLLELLEDNKNFYLPKVAGKDMFACPFKKGDALVKSNFNINEPCSNPVDSSLIDLAVLPALMADKDGVRLGYGGGFYDRFLSQNPNIKTILPIPKELYIDKLPHEEFDIKSDIIITL